MNIRARLTIRFTLIVATLGVIFSIFIYYFSSSYRENGFYNRLKDKAYDYAKILAKLDKGIPDLLTQIDETTAYLPNEQIKVIDDDNQEVFSTFAKNAPESNELLELARLEKETRFKENNDEAIAIYYTEYKKSYIVIISAYDKEGINKLENLKIVLIVGLIIFTIVTTLFGWIFVGQMLKPISQIVNEVESISISNLTNRVNEGNGKDEIAQLAITFNNLLERMQKAFEWQKSFISNSSHEMRTPLTAITGQIEVALMNTREPGEYQAVLNSLLEDIKSVNRLTNGLLELAHADLDISKLKMKALRIDELLWQTRNELLKRNADYKITINIIDFPEDEAKLLVHGSDHLLRSVFINLIDNACKFSADKSVNIQFKTSHNTIDISFSNNGTGIPEQELEKIGQPFFRASNSKGISGHGLGLSLVFKIMSVHGAQINIDSGTNKHTNVALRFNNA